MMMKKLMIGMVVLFCMAFTTQEEKKVTITFTLEEVQTVYDALGELPAKKSEGLRARIAFEANRQLDTTKKK